MRHYVRQQTATAAGFGTGSGCSSTICHRRKLSRLPRQQSAPPDIVDDEDGGAATKRRFDSSSSIDGGGGHGHSMKSIGNWSAFAGFSDSTESLSKRLRALTMSTNGAAAAPTASQQSRMASSPHSSSALEPSQQRKVSEPPGRKKSDMFNVFFSLAKDNINLSGQTTAAAAQAVQQALQPGSSAKDQLIHTVHRMARVRQRLMEPYGRLRRAVRQLRDRYNASKDHNILVRYTQLQKMIVEVIALEKQYWQLIDLPAQEISETPQSYVLKVVGLVEQQRGPFEELPPSKTGAIAQLLGTTLNLAEKTKEQSLFQALKVKSVDDLKSESERLFTELFTLIVRYQGLRIVVKYEGK